MDIILLIVTGILMVIPCWAIATKTGRPGALSLLVFTPFLGGLIYSAILAFGRWPATGEEG